MTALIFAGLVLAWGFTWFALTLQVGVVPPEVSILWRFLISAACLWGGLAATGRLAPVPWSTHRWLAPLGAMLFSMNFLLFYTAAHFTPSGIISVVFSMATVFTAFNQWLFLKKRPTARTLIGGTLGALGIALLFSEAFTEAENAASGGMLIGIGLSLAGTLVFSLGNLVSLKATATGTDLPNAAARAMLWGSLFLALFALARGAPFTFDWSWRYVGSLAYLIGPGTLFGLMAYLWLVGRIGPDKAAYATVLFPVVALGVSTVLEGYHWTLFAMAGLPLVLIGNVVIFSGPRKGPAAG